MIWDLLFGCWLALPCSFTRRPTQRTETQLARTEGDKHRNGPCKGDLDAIDDQENLRRVVRFCKRLIDVEPDLS
jgi:hypothetical protein